LKKTLSFLTVPFSSKKKEAREEQKAKKRKEVDVEKLKETLEKALQEQDEEKS